MAVGQTTSFAVSSPADPLSPYGVLLSLSSNRPLAVPGLALCLSPPLFLLGQGVLDPQGKSSLASSVPQDPSLAFKGFHLQALILDAALNLKTTNDVSITVRP